MTDQEKISYMEARIQYLESGISDAIKALNKPGLQSDTVWFSGVCTMQEHLEYLLEN